MIAVVRSPLLIGLGFRHAFSLRETDPATAGGRAAVAQSIECAPARLHECSQVHGDLVLRVRGDEDPTTTRAKEADALATGAAGVGVGVRVADCVAVLMADPATGAVAAIHAGWRGTVRGVVLRAVEALAAGGSGRAGFAAALFPHIRSCCFEVGDEVATEIASATPECDVIVRGHAKPHVDLAAGIRAQLAHAGLRPERIDDVQGCTKCDRARFHSYRRDGANAGRHLAAIAAR